MQKDHRISLAIILQIILFAPKNSDLGCCPHSLRGIGWPQRKNPPEKARNPLSSEVKGWPSYHEALLFQMESLAFGLLGERGFSTPTSLNSSCINLWGDIKKKTKVVCSKNCVKFLLSPSTWNNSKWQEVFARSLCSPTTTPAATSTTTGPWLWAHLARQTSSGVALPSIAL